MITHSYDAADLFAVMPALPLAGNPAWADLKIESNRSLRGGHCYGAGLYAIHFRGRLLYVGKFLGTRAHAFAGDVCATRWAKHLGTLTLRDRRISFSRGAIDDMRRRQPMVPPLSDIVAAAQEPVITSPRGRVSSLNRALFAAEHWTTLSRIAGAPGLAGFTITYTRIEAAGARDQAGIRAAVGAAEDAVITACRPRCNAVIATGTAREMRLEDAGRILEDALAAALGAPAVAAPEPPPADDGEDADDVAGLTGEEAFLDRIAGDADALQAVARIEQAFDAVADAYVEYTRTGGGDLRIRSTAGRWPFFNVAALQWQRMRRRFSAEIGLTVERALELGASTAVPNGATQTLATRATFDMPGGIDGLVRCLLAAAAGRR